jgi:quercetin dioxygenase-like cupin family protein
MSTVYFSPMARTHWHRHERGQILTIVSGEGIVATRGGTVARVRAGDIVWTEPGTEHWHGALDDAFLVHTSASLGTTAWCDEVTDEDYRHAQRCEGSKVITWR